MSSYDNWKATNPDDERLGRSNGKPEAYRCLDCPWSGKGILPATEHWQVSGHNVKPASDPRFKAKDAMTRKATA